MIGLLPNETANLEMIRAPPCRPGVDVPINHKFVQRLMWQVGLARRFHVSRYQKIRIHFCIRVCNNCAIIQIDHL